MTEVQKIVVSLSLSDVVVEPGGGAQLVVSMTNRQETADRLSLEVEGIDVEWYAIPVPAVNVAPDAQVSERILFKIARSSGNRAGSYPFLVRVQAMETGEVGVAQATLVVKPYSHLQVELDHKRAIATFFRPLNDFDVSITNQGNAEETLNLYASDSDDGCAYEFDTDRITLKPGQTSVVPLAIRPKTTSVLGGTRLYGFTVSARSVDDSYVSANVSGQIEKHALISPFLGIFLLLATVVGGGVYFFRPKPPVPIVIHAFTASTTRIVSGVPVTLSWDVSGSAQQFIIKHRVGREGEEIVDGEQDRAAGSLIVKPEAPQTTYILVVRGAGQPRDAIKNLTIDVAPPPLPVPPGINEFKAAPPRIHPGDMVMLSWKASGVKEAIIDPGNVHLSSLDMTHPETPEQDTTYTLRIVGEDGKTVASKTVDVKVLPKDEPLAEIKFDAANKVIYVGDMAHLKWSVQFAKTVHLTADNNSVDVDVKPDGSRDVKVDVPTVTFTLKAYDSAGQVKTATVIVTTKERPAPPPDTSPPPGVAPTPSTGTPPP
ncbi:MAG TPA: hypothetical protein VKU00_01150 [Chthonomonadaceae bacterium]|nr:hypothetical protein [Chthonomonadaceae bacterium]